MIIESIVAFVLIFSATSIIYLLGRRAAPKPAQTYDECTAYACGEKVTYPKLRVNVSLYKYLIYFVILDSSVLLLAFASFMQAGTNVPLILLYLLMMLAAGLLVFDGGKE
ncbi:MAG: NADH-quinone oxidoreductase subunit A [Candidatus Bathyarchaeota archaeon]|nr:NADH-quinone oxidoreductase subunit A [Candidatus Bathyarchaeota archaeon]